MQFSLSTPNQPKTLLLLSFFLNSFTGNWKNFATEISMFDKKVP